MLNQSDLKTWLHRDLPRLDKILLILGSFDTPSQIKDIKGRATEAGLRAVSKWNPSATLARSKGLAIRTPEGWEITDAGRQHLRNIGVASLSPAAVQVATDLRVALSSISNADTRAFVEEAIKCHEAELYRSAIVMSWLAAVDALHKHVFSNHLAAFNVEAKRVDSRWKDATTTDDLGKMKEADFLDRISALSIVGGNVKKELKNCLDRRNGCGHPNSLRISANTSAHHLEVLLLNIFNVFH